MKHIQKILVATDLSDASSVAFSYALWFADRVGASIDLLHVVFPAADVMDFPALAASVTKTQVETAQIALKAFTDQALTRVQSTTALENVPVVRPMVEVGSPEALIVTNAKELGSDIIIVGSDGEHSRLEIAFGKVSTSVVSRSHIPVLLIPSAINAIQIKTIGFATDLDDADPFHIWRASQLLTPFNAFLKVVHIRKDYDEKKDIDLPALETFLAGKDLALQVSFHEFIGEDIEEGLEDFITMHKIDLLVMHSPKRNIFERLGHRSLTRKMALYCDVPLLVLK